MGPTMTTTRELHLMITQIIAAALGGLYQGSSDEARTTYI